MVDLDRPLTDYFINSTHNTYITGHQLKGLSDAKMYSLAMLEGYRLVELDCYNGKGDEIIITHGYTLVSDLNLVDILKELGENLPEKKHREVAEEGLARFDLNNNGKIEFNEFFEFIRFLVSEKGYAL